VTASPTCPTSDPTFSTRAPTLFPSISPTHKGLESFIMPIDGCDVFHQYQFRFIRNGEVIATSIQFPEGN
jgi:hypothetical protein